MPITTNRFRHVLGHLAGGVAIVTSRGPDGAPHGLTATAVCSVSLEPPLVLVSIAGHTHTHAAIRASGCYAINFLGPEHVDYARRFGISGGEKFDDLSVGRAATGAPILEGVLGCCDCTVVDELEAGDHTLFVGHVETGRVRQDEGEGPLVYYRGSYRELGASPVWPAPEADAP